ncbi:unnamed protein product [Phaedon cochleariae]|uniref:Uncharacterized protein n=1 Tax=Phaedon cochleariae TaxID=80249 RepID=A0A9P0DXD9_PHACE|nr:unnamed protein product [Phaedon cochleariae]
MRLLPLFLLIFLSLDVNAQRRTTAKPESTSATPRSVSRGRGRSRFVSTEDYVQLHDSPEPTSRRVASRKRVIENTEQRVPPRVVGTLLKTDNYARVPTVTPKPDISPRATNSAAKPGRTSTRVSNFVHSRGEALEKRPLKHETIDRRSFSAVEIERRTARPVPAESSEHAEVSNPIKNTYEVQEVPEEQLEFEPIRRVKKTRVLTESHFAAKNFPRRNSLQSLPTESPEAFKSTSKTSTSTEASVSYSPEDTNNVEEADDTTLKTLPLEVSSEPPVPKEEPLSELNSQPPDTPKTTEPARSQNLRRNGARRTHSSTDQTTQATRARTRTRVTKVPEALFQPAAPSRSSRRRTGGPSVFTAEVSQSEPRSRTGRTIESTPEKITIDLTSRRSRRNSTPSSAPVKTGQATTTRSTATTARSSRKRQPSTLRSSRSRSRSVEPVIDETKLEVLPLFETEPRIVNSVRGRGKSRAEKRSDELVVPENFLTSATENNDRVTRPKVTFSVNVETRTQATLRGKPNEIRESVVSEVSQVISRRTVARKKDSGLGVKIKVFDPLARGSKKGELKKPEKWKNSSEEIDESDNYPEPFKALIKANKGKKESSVEKITKSGPSITNSVTTTSSTSSPSSARLLSRGPTTTISVTAKEINDIDNELFPKPSSTTTPLPRTSRSRSSRTPTEPPTLPSRRNAPEIGPTPFNPAGRKTHGGVAFKPKEGRASSKRRERGDEQVPTKVPKLAIDAAKQERRKYRSDLASRSTLPRSTTNAPRYIPTIPSMPYVPTIPNITPPRTSVFSEASKKDPDLGLEVISFDDPVPPLPSENLVKENPFSIALPLVSDGTTEKPVSIFERIINSITAISTPSPVSNDFSSITSSTTESESAILKLAPKKTDYDETAQTLITPTFTTDKSTTIIEKILSSINAIQATDNTNSAQVRTDFNTLSFSTTPMSPVRALTNTPTDTTHTLPAQFSTSSIDPLSVLNEITPEQALQKRTIGKLLEILNSMVSTTLQPQKLVVVTPKSLNFASAVNTDGIGQSFGAISSTTFPPSTTTEPSTITTTETPSTTFLSSTETITEDSTTFTDQILSTTTSDSELLGTSSTTTESQSTSTLLYTSTDSTTTTSSTESTSFPSPSEVGLVSSVDPYSFFSLTSTLPPLEKFEVSPGSVSIFSANDLSNSIAPEDNLSTTISILSRSNFDNTATTQSSTTTDGSTTLEPTTTESFTSTTEELRMTTLDSTTTPGSSTTKASVVNVNKDIVTNRLGRLLNILQDPVQNSIDFSTPSTTTSTTPDYFVFAVLNNNTILRKKPPTVPNKNTPYLIVGVYPDNTVVRRYPNGTMVPMEQVIRVRGFDTRENPPPLPEITSNQVTNERGVSEEDSRNFQTAKQNSIPSFEANPLPLNSGSTSSTTSVTNLASTSTPERSPRTNNRIFTTTTSSTTHVSSGTTQRSLGTTETEVPLGSTLTPIGTNTESDFAGTVDTVTVASSTVSGTTSGTTNPTLSTLSELFDGRTLNAFNEIVNRVDTNTDTIATTQQVIKVDATTFQPQSSTTLSTIGTTVSPSTTTETIFTDSPIKVTTENQVTISNEILEDRTTPAMSTTSAPTTTTIRFTTTTRKVPVTTKSVRLTTTPTKVPVTTKSVRLTTTPTKVTSTLSTRLPEAEPTAPFIPTFLTTLFPNLFATEVPATRAPRVLSTKSPGVIRISAAPSVTENLFVAASTTRATTVAPPSTTITTTTTTTPRPTTRSTTTSKPTTRSTTITPRPTTRSTTTPRATTRGTTTTESTTTTRATTRGTTTTESTTNSVSTTTEKNVPVTNISPIEMTTKKKLKVLTEEQKENLKTLVQLEKEQAALLQQLSFLTNLNLGGRSVAPKKTKTQKPTSKNLADRVVALAVERDKTAKTTTQKPPSSIQDQLAAIEATRQPKQLTPSIEEVLKQYNLGDIDIDIATTPQTSYGKSNDAILASILKQQGIAPPTPKSLADQIKQAGLFDDTTTRRPKPKQKPRPRVTTTPPPSRLMQGLNWLLNALAPVPQATPRPTRRPAKPKARKPPVDQLELLANAPTHVTPVITAAPTKQRGGVTHKENTSGGSNSLSQEDIQKLIAQLEGLQKDSSKQALDLSQIKSLQNLINTDEGVVVLANGEHGTTSRRTTAGPPTSSSRTTTARSTSASTTRKRQQRKLTTVPAPVSVSNSVEDYDEEDFEVTTKKHKAPIGFRPVPGVDDDSSESFVRSNLITAAVNVTKAISGFLGTALQGAAQSFKSIWGSGSALGSRVLGAASGSSAGPG